jgi:hypothetical protein
MDASMDQLTSLLYHISACLRVLKKGDFSDSIGLVNCAF